MLPRLSFALLAVGCVLAACTAPSFTFAPESTGGFGGSGASASASTSSTGNGGGGSSSVSASSSASSSAASSTGAMSTSSTGAASSSSGIVCNEPNKICGGQCVGQSTDNGCADPACMPCGSAPPNGTSVCNQGLCDFYCASGFTRMGPQCVCNINCAAGYVCDGTGVCQCQNPVCDAACKAAQHLGGACVFGVCGCL